MWKWQIIFILLFDYCRLQITVYYEGLGTRKQFCNVIHNGEERKDFGNWTGKGTCGSGLLGRDGGYLRTGPKGKKLTGGSTKFHDDKLRHLPVPVAARSKAKTRMLRLWVRIPPGACMSVCCECVLSGRGSLRRDDHSPRRVLPTVVRRCVCDLEISWMRRSWHTGGCRAKNKQTNFIICTHQLWLTLILLTWRIWWAPNNASKWQMGFNSAFKWLIIIIFYFFIIINILTAIGLAPGGSSPVHIYREHYIEYTNNTQNT